MQRAKGKWQMVFWVALFCVSYFLPHAAFAATNISSSTSQHWAWNDIIGWIDFYNTSNITVSSTNLSGYASSSAGYLSLDCATSPAGNLCSTSTYQIVNDGSGNLSGWAWNDVIGWISFNCANTGGCGTVSYNVYIDASGNFHGYAWNDAVGWISFNCLDVGASFCVSTSNYEVATTWAGVGTTGYLDSTTFDTGVASGTELNSVLWLGSLNGLANGSVGFQFAGSSSSSGPWTFTGPDGTASTSYIGLPSIPIPITNYAAYNIYRYFRYRVILTSGVGQSASPQVRDVSVDWSP
jgi:hypothetical protein